MHKAGFVNIVGNPNVGKSTLMNQLEIINPQFRNCFKKSLVGLKIVIMMSWGFI